MTDEPPKAASFAGVDVNASVRDLRKIWGTLRQQEGLDPDQDDSSAAQTALYCTHFLSTWGQRMWEFSIGLILLELCPDSLALVALFGLIDSIAQVIAGPHIGAYVDRTPRLVAAVSMYRLQNAAVAVSAFSAFLTSFLTMGSPVYWITVLATILIGAVSSVGCQGSSLSVEREWTKALCQEDSASLAAFNAGMRRLDLTCLIASPIMAGCLMTFGSIRIAIVGILLWNMLAWWPECRLLKLAQHFSPVLRQQELAPRSEEGPELSMESVKKSIATSVEAWQLYRSQPVFPAAVALAMLYLTVMNFGLLMTAYLKWRGMLETTLSLYRAAGALAGIGATLVFPELHARSGLDGSGCVGIGCQWVFLLVTLIVASTLGQPAGTHVLAVGLVGSRFGLWAFDLAVSQMLQERVPNEQLGVVNGMQSSLQSLLQSLSYALGLVIWQPQLFLLLMTSSVLVVSVALVLYLYFIGAKEWLSERFGRQQEYQPMQAGPTEQIASI